MNINYKQAPHIFSNTALVHYSYFELLHDILDYSIPIEPETIIGLSILSEAVVLHEEIVTNNNELLTSNDYEASLVGQFIKKGVLKYQMINNRLFLPLDNSAAEMMNNEIKLYLNKNHLGMDDIRQAEIFLSRSHNMSVYQMGFYDEEHLQKAIDYEITKEKIAKLHGMSCINGIYSADFGNLFYDFVELSMCINTSVSKGLLENIDKKRFMYVDKLKRYLGNTYVGLPSVISIILSRSRDIGDIPYQMMLLRDEMSEFRKSCTNFECSLRNENNFLRQCEIIDEIENAYNSLRVDGNVKKKRRIIKESAEMIDLNPISMLTNIGKKAAGELDEKLLQLKIPGYYDLYRKSFDVEENLYSLQRLFGKAINDNFIRKINSLSRIE